MNKVTVDKNNSKPERQPQLGDIYQCPANGSFYIIANLSWNGEGDCMPRRQDEERSFAAINLSTGERWYEGHENPARGLYRDLVYVGSNADITVKCN